MSENKSSRAIVMEHAAQRRGSFLGEFIDFLAHTKKWWLTPIVVALLLLGGFILLAGTAAAPFIYTLF